MNYIRRILFSSLQKIEERYYNRYPSLGNVLMFHQVNDDCLLWDDVRYSITKKSFREFIESTSNFEKISTILEENNNIKNYITFDDAYDDIYQFAFPILKENKVPFTVFVAPDMLDCDKFLTTEHLKELSKSPLCTVGAHSVSHKMLRFLSNRDAKNEIEQSKKIIENLISKKVDYFAFPYGSKYACSQKNIELVKNTEYKVAFSTINCSLNYRIFKNKWFLPRRNVNEKNYREIIKQISNENN